MAIELHAPPPDPAAPRPAPAESPQGAPAAGGPEPGRAAGLPWQGIGVAVFFGILALLLLWDQDALGSRIRAVFVLVAAGIGFLLVVIFDRRWMMRRAACSIILGLAGFGALRAFKADVTIPVLEARLRFDSGFGWPDALVFGLALLVAAILAIWEQKASDL